MKLTDSEKFVKMLLRQSELNSQVAGLDWRATCYAWHTTIWTECAELMETIPSWKWWKDYHHDKSKFRAELIDVWHFGMSSMLAAEPLEAVAGFMYLAYVNVQKQHVVFTTIKLIEDIAVSALVYQRFSPAEFFRVMKSVGITIDDLYLHYFAKSTLNSFRNEKGYQAGQYLWNSSIDNLVLTEILEENPQLINDSPSTIELTIRFWLEFHYPKSSHK